ncbi:MAG: DUF6934 family protein [Thermoflexibacteraceae bacterium]
MIINNLYYHTFFTTTNLGFGDKHPITGEIDDLAVTDNGDSEKVLATVAATVYEVTTHYKNQAF